MKHNILKALSTIALAASVSLPVSATIIDDTYTGSIDHGWGDRIGNHSTAGGGYTFEVHNMNVSLTGTVLNVKINTNYAGHTGLYGTGYGDLFISNSWNPFGAAPFADDNNVTGTNWTYGISLDGDIYNQNGSLSKSGARFTSNAGGTSSLYALNGTNDQDAFLSDNLTSGTFRNGQEVVVDQRSATTQDTGINGTWSINSLDLDDFITFEIDLAGTGLLASNEIALHWGMTCGNDTIEGAYSVPEPGMLALVIVGLVGIGFTAKSKNVKV